MNHETRYPGVIFMGTPKIAADILQTLLDEGCQIDLVVCQPDKKTGRKGVLTPCPVKELALSRGLPVFSPEKIRTDFQPVLDVSPKLIVTCAYGQIVPQEVLVAPEHGCINLHASNLPQYRGAAPIQRAIMDGQKQTAMSLMKMEAGLDTGPVALKETVVIDPEDNSTSLFEKMAKAGSSLIARSLDALYSDSLIFTDQSEENVSYAAKITKEEEHLDLSLSDEQILNRIRGLALDPGGYVLAQGKKLKLLSVTYRPGSTPGIGVFDKEGKKTMILGGHEGVFILDLVQLEGKKPMKGSEFVNGSGRSLPGKKGE